MKKILLLAFVVMAMVSCSKDNEENNTNMSVGMVTRDADYIRDSLARAHSGEDIDTVSPNISVEWIHNDCLQSDGGSVSMDWIDLGLPSGTLWAECNVGATTPTGTGDWISWADTNTHKTSFTIDTYWDYAGTTAQDCWGFNYHCMSKYGEMNYWTTNWLFYTEDDICTKLYGSSAQTPAWADYKELINNTTYCIENVTLTQEDSVVAPATTCIVFTSKTNGHKLYMPLAGLMYGNTHYPSTVGSNKYGPVAWYWTRNWQTFCDGFEENQEFAQIFSVDRTTLNWIFNWNIYTAKWEGLQVRAIKK